MSTKATQTESGIGSVSDLPRGVARLGTDGKGAVHYFYGPPRWTVWVVMDDELVHEQQIETGAVEQWMGFIEDEHGWTKNRYNLTLGELLDEHFNGGEC